MLSVVIPTLDAAAQLGAALRILAEAGLGDIIVADGGSADGTVALAVAAGATVVRVARGRGGQLAAGIAAARGPWLLLLHADTRLGPGWLDYARAHMAGHADRAGYFRFKLDSDDVRARRLERAVAWRCRVLALPYGDQGLLIHRDLLARAGGMRALPLMEDVDLARRLGRARLRPIDADAITSAARWERGGWRLRSVRNIMCLSAYFAGVPPSLIARAYR